jgi:hypothetical protein
MFNKKQYWENRKNGIRGTGEPNVIKEIYTPQEWQEHKCEEREKGLWKMKNKTTKK